MAEVELFQPGNYRFVTHAFQYSGGVEALTGYAIERVRFVKPLKLADGFAAAEAHMARMGRPPTSFCACELRSPGQFTDQGFIDFNRHYVQQLAAWGIFHDDINPVARSNVCPEIDPPAEPSMYAFCYTVPGAGGFVIAGSGEAGGSGGPYGERIVRLGDQSADGMRDKGRFVLGAMEERMGKLDRGWADVTATQLYTVFDVYAHFAEEFIRRGAAAGGVTWHFCRPPVQGLDYEVDVRGVTRELVV
ncbi:MAG TPA: hypothetical protein VMB84_04025 [Stellaceae bacterium]|nr:hypothetical protein [Stellaceae bacterium]